MEAAVRRRDSTLNEERSLKKPFRNVSQNPAPNELLLPLYLVRTGNVT